MEYQPILDCIYAERPEVPIECKVADYIPELAKVPGHKYGIHLTDVEGGQYAVGDSEEKFSAQSITKVLALTLALSLEGEEIWKRVGVEPSGDPFNSLVQLEYEDGIPRNPLINAGALVICDILISHFDDPKKGFLDFVCSLTKDKDLGYNYAVAQSEKKWGFRNAALTNLMKAYGNIHNDVEEVLDFYFHQCALEMSCRQLANVFLLYALHGQIYHNGKTLMPASYIKRINAIMQSCGFYDEAGEFSFTVGLPGKSGVGGGIVAIYPQQYSVACWSPPLNYKGNSFLGMKSLEMLTTLTGRSIF